MELHEALYTTRAMRRLRPDPIPLEVQARILDAAIRAPHVDEQWRFVLVDDRALMARLGELYREASAEMFALNGIDFEALRQSDSPHGRAARSAGWQLRHFDEVPLLLLGYSRAGAGGVLPALWSAALAARAEGIGATLTTILASFRAAQVNELLGVPVADGWTLQGVVPLGYPRGRWGVAQRRPVHEVAARNGWQGELGFEAPEPLWPR